MEEFLERQLLMRVWVFATFSTIEKALAGLHERLSRVVCCARLLYKIVLAQHERKQLHKSDNNFTWKRNGRRTPSWHRDK